MLCVEYNLCGKHADGWGGCKKGRWVVGKGRRSGMGGELVVGEINSVWKELALVVLSVCRGTKKKIFFFKQKTAYEISL